MERKIKVFGIPWHISHQAELLKLHEYGIDFTFLVNNVRHWGARSYFGDEAREMPKHLKWVTEYEPGKYDLAILHLDQQCVARDIGKGQLFRMVNEQITDIPKIIINHGTPMWTERFKEEVVIYGGEEIKEGKAIRVDGISELVGDSFMVVNSYKAAERWGWGYPIIHGLDPDEFWDLPKDHRVITTLSPGGLDRYYNRMLLSAVRGLLKEQTGMSLRQTSIDYKPINFDDYRDWIGRSAIYFNPTLDSPMPRARTEAMLSGSCIVTTNHHNEDMFIKNGVTGFIVPDNPMEIVKTLKLLLFDEYKAALRVGQQGKEFAKKYFHKKKFQRAWLDLIQGVLNKNKLTKEMEAGYVSQGIKEKTFGQRPREN